MSEDYTYDAPVTDWRKRAEAAERERDELRARLDAVPVAAIRGCWEQKYEDEEDWENDSAAVWDWLNTLSQAAQPNPADDAPDGALSLAAIDDEDGDL